MTVLYRDILVNKYPEAEWRIEENDYETLEWFSDEPKPSQKTLDSFAAEVHTLMNNQVDARSSAITKLKALGLTDTEIAALVG